MIRIYLDWNVISNLKRPENDVMKAFIDEHKQHLLFPYSPAHFNDLMKSHLPENGYFQVDLEMLEYLSGKHLLRWEEDGTKPLFGTPSEYFEGEKNKEDIFSLMDMERVFSELSEVGESLDTPQLGELLKTLYQLQPIGFEVNDSNKKILQKIFPDITSDSTMWDLMKGVGPFSRNLLQDRDYYKDFRKTLGEQGFKIEDNAGNWSEDEVVNRIDGFLKGLGAEMTFIEYVKSTFKHRKEPINRYEFFTTAYLMLDMIGYKSDKLPKSTDNLQNIQTDAEHAFYGAHCDYFVVGDKNLRLKSKVLYKKLNIATEILSPGEFVTCLGKVIHKTPVRPYDFIEEVSSFIDSERIVESRHLSEDSETTTHIIRLPLFYFNFFNYIAYSNHPEQNGIVLNFIKASDNYSKFTYFTELENLVDDMVNAFGFDDKEEFSRIKNEFVYENRDAQIIWNFGSCLAILERDPETGGVIFSYIMTLKKENSD